MSLESVHPEIRITLADLAAIARDGSVVLEAWPADTDKRPLRPVGSVRVHVDPVVREFAASVLAVMVTPAPRPLTEELGGAR